jgi:GT2 family glycosyltransferase
VACIDSLSAQTYTALRIIVVDGGSTDGTPDRIRGEYPQVEVLQGQEELWWGEAMQVGVEYSLRHSRHDDDMLLMMNNDTLIDPDYVATLVRVSQERNAAVGGMIVDSRDPSRILDAGELVDWKTYSFTVKTVREADETYVAGMDLLSGRGTLIPLFMVRRAGNVNGARFPHYIADCEFFARLKREGFQLGVSCEAIVRSHVDVTGLSTQHADPLTFAQAWRALFSTRSMDNVRNHWRFIEDCAPPHLRRPLQRRLIRRCAYLVASRTVLRHVALPLAWFLTGLYYVTKEDCAACGCEADELRRAGVLKTWRRDDWYLLEQQCLDQIKDDGLRRLYRRAWNPATKVIRWIKARR